MSAAEEHEEDVRLDASRLCSKLVCYGAVQTAMARRLSMASRIARRSFSDRTLMAANILAVDIGVLA